MVPYVLAFALHFQKRKSDLEDFFHMRSFISLIYYRIWKNEPTIDKSETKKVIEKLHNTSYRKPVFSVIVF